MRQRTYTEHFLACPGRPALFTITHAGPLDDTWLGREETRVLLDVSFPRMSDYSYTSTVGAYMSSVRVVVEYRDALDNDMKPLREVLTELDGAGRLPGPLLPPPG